MVADSPICRLNGSSDILYIGQSMNLGEEEKGRFWSYMHPNKHESRIRQRITQLMKQGRQVSLYLCRSPPGGSSVSEHEKELLRKYAEEHWELPPFNSQA